jgi:hypothetical protein
MIQKLIVLTFLLFYIPFNNTFGSIERLEVDTDFTIPLLPNWSIDSSQSEFPYQIFHNNERAELNIFKSLLEPDERVYNNDEFKLAVEGVIDDILLNLPEAQLLINNGFFEENHLSFQLEFTSYDTTSGVTLKHLIKSLIYRLPDDYQVMYTLWGRLHNRDYEILSEEILFYQDNFVFIGEAELKFYPERTFYKWTTLFVVVIIFFVGIYIIARKYRMKTTTQ